MNLLHQTGVRWREPEPIPLDQEPLSDDPLLHRLLYRRGVRSRREADAFLDPRPKPAPTRNRLPNIDAAIDRIERALDAGERMAVFGDYDVDGITSAAILFSSLRAMAADPESIAVRLPARSEGYGLNERAIEEIAADGATLIVAVDCGSNDHASVARARQLGLDVVVFDHHQIGGPTPDGAIVVSAQLGENGDLRELCAAGVAFLAASELSRRGRALPPGGDRALLDLVALGSIGDVMSLAGVNRPLVRDGLVQLRLARRPGVRALIQRAALMPSTITSEDVSFKLTPRLNAAGRVSHPMVAFDLLMAPDAECANRHSVELELLNDQRKDRAKSVLDDVDEMIGREPELTARPVLVFSSENWSAGLVGPAAAKLCERFARPVVMLAVEGDLLHGSARSVPGFDIARALSNHADLLERHGGHDQAAGMTLRRDRLAELIAALNASAPSGELEGEVFDIEADLDASRLTLETARAIESLQPFGHRNPNPLLRIRGLRVQRIEIIGKDRTHLRLVLGHGRKTTKAVMFGAAQRASDIEPGALIDVLAQISIDSWNGAERLDLSLKDFRPAERYSGSH